MSMCRVVTMRRPLLPRRHHHDHDQRDQQPQPPTFHDLDQVRGELDTAEHHPGADEPPRRLDRLEARGFLSRTRPGRNRRSLEVRLTPARHALGDALVAGLIPALTDIVDDISPPACRALLAVLEQIAAALAVLARDPDKPPHVVPRIPAPAAQFRLPGAGTAALGGGGHAGAAAFGEDGEFDQADGLDSAPTAIS
jgi:hypothetical protein